VSDTSKGPASGEHSSVQDELGFDPDSPDVSDPQVDPIGPAIAPLDKKNTDKDERKPPYDPLGDLKT
jgi:hypothetical protein